MVYAHLLLAHLSDTYVKRNLIDQTLGLNKGLLSTLLRARPENFDYSYFTADTQIRCEVA